MSSKLFHTVVAFGIALSGAACAEAPAEETQSEESAVVAPPAQGPDWDAFCDATWPTTKGGTQTLPACIDPQNQCEQTQTESCFTKVGDAGACTWGLWLDDFVAVCTGPETWQCKPGKMKGSECKCWVEPGQTECPPEPENKKPAKSSTPPTGAKKGEARAQATNAQ